VIAMLKPLSALSSGDRLFFRMGERLWPARVSPSLHTSTSDPGAGRVAPGGQSEESFTLFGDGEQLPWAVDGDVHRISNFTRFFSFTPL